MAAPHQERRWCPHTVQVTHGHRLGCEKKTCLQATGHLSHHDPLQAVRVQLAPSSLGWGGQSAVLQEAQGHLVETDQFIAGWAN